MLHRHPVLSIITLAYIVFVGLVTLTPAPFDSNVNGTIARVLRLFARHELTEWITYSRLEFMANIGMFVPIGLFLVLLFGRRFWWVGIAFGVAFTLFIEGFQGVVLSATRYSTVSDIVANSAGAVLGVGLGLIVTAGSARRARDRKATRDRLRTAA
ncbi:VanZ like family protein [Paramicrobacterium humi]|uniref:VanZ like family protein n=1 Tax=Paramicrobacterium humi TaxID=640635 RepID=A0A1H4PNP6_9MICO|nr:VanZ family protein [Microbacterium humi]SEC09036.1 VanZ like family protein [Microbacterium humi]